MRDFADYAQITMKGVSSNNKDVIKTVFDCMDIHYDAEDSLRFIDNYINLDNLSTEIKEFIKQKREDYKFYIDNLNKY